MALKQPYEAIYLDIDVPPKRLRFPPAFVDRCMETLPRLPFEVVEDSPPYPPAEPDNA